MGTIIFFVPVPQMIKRLIEILAKPSIISIKLIKYREELGTM